MLLFIFMSKQLEYLNCAKTIIRRLLFTNPAEKLQIATVSAENQVDTEPVNASPASIELIDYIDQLIEALLTSNESIDQQNNETKFKVAFQVIQQMIINILESEKDETIAPAKGRKKIQKPSTEVIIFTNLKNAKFSDTLAQKMIEEFKNENIKMYIFTESISYPIPENTIDEHLPMIMKNPSLFSEELKPLQQLIVDTGGFIGNINFAASLFENLRIRKLPQAWNVDFRIGSKIKIPMCGYRKTIGYSEPKWHFKKRPLEVSNQGETSGLQQQGFKRNFKEDFKEEKEEEIAKNEIKPDEWETDEKIFDVHITNEGVGYLTKEEKKAHKPKTIRCLDLLFTMDKNEVHEIHHGKPVYLLKPNPKKQENIRAFNAFANALVQRNLVGIARKCYNRNTYPKLVVLRPYKIQDEVIIESFLLPFKDNCVDPLDYINGTTGLWKIPSKDYQLDPKIKINAELQEHVNDYLKELTIKEDDHLNMLPPQLQFNPKLDYLYQKIIERAKQTKENEIIEPEEWESSLSNLHIKNSQPKFLKSRATDALNELIMKLNI
ncbi:uncharacterized protein LOC123300101 [Chrysoperla carnea]|uniref:uncharacterized protein LOC123300101 n=1 Tax=Chrysoperla carnea TaxID=189513 RepID=UPI001D081B4F|nr:uncharacterized protein LOC123300101 [Chrysoperla carnea]